MVVKLIENLDQVPVQVSPACLGILEVVFQGKFEKASRLTGPFAVWWLVMMALFSLVVESVSLTVSIPLPPPHDHFLVAAVLKEVPGPSR